MTMWSTFLQADQQLFFWINRQAISPCLDQFMPWISDPKAFYPLLGGGSLLLLIFGGFRGRIFLLLMILALAIGDAGIGWTIKRTVHRPRPYQALAGVRMVKRQSVTYSGEPVPVHDGNSFTSGHACNNVALAFMACAVYGRWASALWFWAFLVSYSRVYTGNHYPSDILGSWLIAPLYCWLIVAPLRSGWRKVAPRCWPAVWARHPFLTGRAVRARGVPTP